MNPRQIDRFFRILGHEYDDPATIILTGAAAGSLWGNRRPSLDIDFGVTLHGRRRNRWVLFEHALAKTRKLSGIPVNYAEDLDRWGSISLLDYRRHTRRYRKFRKLDVRLLDPVYWSIGKLSRYLDPDVHDLAAVLKRQRVPVSQLTRIWARAVKASPRSMACEHFCRQTEHFLRRIGPSIWGKTFDGEEAVRQFQRGLASGAGRRRSGRA